MTVTLYRPGQQPTTETSDGFSIPEPADFAHVPPQAAALLDCAPSLVDVLASGESYVVYTIFDSEEESNPVATQAVAKLTGTDFDVTDENELLRGPVLIVKVKENLSY